MPFIVNVPVNSAIKYFHTEIEHLMLAMLVKMSFVFIDYKWLLKYLLHAFMMLKCNCGSMKPIQYYFDMLEVKCEIILNDCQ